jgi:Xaa-Pro aminopeptidase
MLMEKEDSMFDAQVYSSRRAALIRALGDNDVRDGLVVLLGNNESPMNYAANCFRFWQDASFRYFVGIDQPRLAVAIDVASGRTVLYGDNLSMEDIVWTGPQPTVAELAARSGISVTLPRARLGDDCTAAAGRGAGILYLPPYRADTQRELARLSGRPEATVIAGASVPLIRTVVALREVKSEGEVAEMESAVAVSIEMHKAAMAFAQAGMKEAEVSAKVSEVALASGGDVAFPVIATTNGAVLHNLTQDRLLIDGGLFLLDAGVQTASGYAGDLSTTFPIGKRFDGRQRDIYEIVLEAMRAACALLSPGVSFLDVHLAAARVIASGLSALGIMKGNIDEAVAAGAHALFFPCGVGHQIGLDCHDMENYGEKWVGYDGAERSGQFGLDHLRLGKPLKPGMTFTIEPGIYFMPELFASWKAEGRFRDFLVYDAIERWIGFGGMRNEENWLVTPLGARRLGPAFDKSAEAIEALRA